MQFQKVWTGLPALIHGTAVCQNLSQDWPQQCLSKEFRKKTFFIGLKTTGSTSNLCTSASNQKPQQVLITNSKITLLCTSEVPGHPGPEIRVSEVLNRFGYKIRSKNQPNYSFMQNSVSEIHCSHLTWMIFTPHLSTSLASGRGGETENGHSGQGPAWTLCLVAVIHNIYIHNVTYVWQLSLALSCKFVDKFRAKFLIEINTLPPENQEEKEKQHLITGSLGNKDCFAFQECGWRL